VTAMYDSRFVRAWRLYLAGSIAAFRGGHLQLFQILFTGSQREPLFWTRDELYSDAGPAVEAAMPVVEQVREKVKWTHAMS
jgi:cyclopropane-fatty-acyl-phospholipid synthase